MVDLRLRNLSFLAKRAWHYATKGDSLWKSLIMAKYDSADHMWRWNTSRPRFTRQWDEDFVLARYVVLGGFFISYVFEVVSPDIYAAFLGF
ncbi:hypothetical protein V6N12_065600 [Hibiscus sabdariffa]|uniref:Uncharacterized protein n=1 Tax=Hibiscus sabdariffa TaxID=183260 RepID=A0ABR2GA69_9ROSI